MDKKTSEFVSYNNKIKELINEEPFISLEGSSCGKLSLSRKCMSRNSSDSLNSINNEDVQRSRNRRSTSASSSSNDRKGKKLMTLFSALIRGNKSTLQASSGSLNDISEVNKLKKQKVS